MIDRGLAMFTSRNLNFSFFLLVFLNSFFMFSHNQMFSYVSLNTRGLRDFVKRKFFFVKMKGHNVFFSKKLTLLTLMKNSGQTSGEIKYSSLMVLIGQQAFLYS